MNARSAGNLPAELTSFVGRRVDLMQAKNLLATSRLLTLTGMGGVGKTRFARRLASETRRAFPDGAWLIALADLRQGSLLAQTISSILGVRDESTNPVGTLIEHLRERRLLLVLDNCEHLTESCALLIGELLRSAPRLKVIATSRHVLGAEGEQVFPISPLSYESSDDGGADAMELFEERAAAANPAFRITDENREPVAQICQTVEGLPLAVELAAANVRTLTPGDILRRMQDVDLLTAGERTRPSRHRTMTAAIEWSYQLCTAQERQAWEQLSVFAGGFTVESAEAVCSTTEPGSPVIGALMGLVDKSIMVRMDGTHGDHARYRMLEPVRQYAADRLGASADVLAVRRRHRDYFLQLARRGAIDYCSEKDVTWYAATCTEKANIREALEASLTSLGEPQVAAEMATALRHFWQQSGSLLEGYRWLLRALDAAPAPSRVRAAALAAAAILAYLLDESRDARELFRQHRDLTAALACDEFTAVAAFTDAFDAFANGDIRLAFENAERSVELGLDRETPGVVAEAMALSALLAFVLEHDRAEEVATRFVGYTERQGSQLLKAIALYPLAAVRWREGDIVSANDLLQQAIRLYQLFEHPSMVAACIEGLAWCTAESEPDRAATLLGAANSTWMFSRMRFPQVAVHQVRDAIEAKLRQELGDPGFEQAVAAGQELPYCQAVALALGSQSESRPKHKDRAARAGLTRREREIAALVADGLTNREIAAKLVISHRTADAHVEHILAKLGFRSRAQIARWLGQEAAG